MEIIRIKNLSLSYPSKKEVLRDVVVDIKRGEVLGIEGESGSGKSTLAACICGLQKNYTGSVSYSPPLRKTRRGIQGIHMVFQDPYSSINPRLTVAEAVSEGLHIRGGYSREDILREAEAVLLLAGLSRDYLFRRVSTLSGGERQRTAIARGLILKPSVLIFDEATVSLDLISQREVLSVMQDLAGTDMSLIIISHDRSLLELLSHRILRVEDGSVEEVWRRG